MVASTFRQFGMANGFQTWSGLNVFLDVANNRVISLTRTGNTQFNQFANPKHWYYVVHDLEGNPVSETAMTTVLAMSGGESAWPMTQIGQYIYAMTWSGETSVFLPSSATAKLSKISIDTGLEVATCTPDQTVMKGGTGSDIPWAAVPFVINGVNYIAILQNKPAAGTNLSIIDADSMVEVTTAAISFAGIGATPYAACIVAGATTSSTCDLFIVYSWNTFTKIGLHKVTFDIAPSLTPSHVDDILGSDVMTGWSGFNSMANTVVDPNDGGIIILLDGDYSGFDRTTLNWAALFKVNPANGDVIWSVPNRGFTDFSNTSQNAFVRSDLSQGTLVITDMWSFTEYDLTDGTILNKWWYDKTDYGDEAGLGVWDGTNRYFGYTTLRGDSLTWNGVAYLPLPFTRTNWAQPGGLFGSTYMQGGYPIFAGWQDPLEPFYYVLREDYSYAGYQLAKISTADGTTVAELFVDYDDNTNTHLDFFAQNSDVIGSKNGTKLYIWTRDGGQQALIEFDKATLAILNTYDLGSLSYSNGTIGHGSGYAQAMSNDGQFIAVVGNINFTGNVFSNNFVVTESWLTIFDTVSGTLAYFDLVATHGWGQESQNYAIWFRDNGELCFTSTPINNRGEQTAATKVWHCAVTSPGGTPALSVTGTHDLTADDEFSFPYPGHASNVSYVQSGSYHSGDDVATIFLIKIDVGSITARPVVSYNCETNVSENVVTGNTFPFTTDYINFVFRNGCCATGYIYIAWNTSGGLDKVELLDALAKTVTEYDITDTWSNRATDFGGATCASYDPDAEVINMHSTGSSDDALGGYSDLLLFFTTPEDEADCVYTAECPTVEPFPAADEEPCDIEWPFVELQPRHVGLHKRKGNIGGGPALAGGNEQVVDGNGFWCITYDGLLIRTNDQVKAWRKMEAYLEGRGGVVCVHAYDGKRAPWLVVGDPIDIVSASTWFVNSNYGYITVNSGGVLQKGMVFSAGKRLYELTSVGPPVGDPPSYLCSIWPRVRTQILIDDVLEFRRPVLSCRLKDDSGMNMELDLLRFAEQTIEFEEDW